MEAASILPIPVRSGSHLESKTGEKDAREADFPIREENTNWSWLLELAKYVKKRQNGVKTDKMADKKIIPVAQAAQVLVATKQLKENSKEAIDLKQMDTVALLSKKWGKFRLMVHLLRNSVRMDDFVYIIESKEDYLCFP
jgi:hypothetical protein